MLASNPHTLDHLARYDRAWTDAQRPTATLLPLPLWKRDRLFLLAWMFHMTGMRPRLSTLLISLVIVSSYSADDAA